MLFFVLSSVLAAAAVRTPELPPGQYVGDWPLHPIDEAAWTQVEEGFVEAMAPRDIESDPALHILIPAMFADGGYFCGSYVGRLEPSNTDKLFLFVAEILPEGIKAVQTLLNRGWSWRTGPRPRRISNTIAQTWTRNAERRLSTRDSPAPSAAPGSRHTKPQPLNPSRPYGTT